MSLETKSISVPYVTLIRSGSKMPVIGLGTWRLQRNAGDVVRDAFEVGYRHFDCAHIYKNESEIGVAFKELLEKGTIKRSDIFVTSKLWNTFHHPSMVRKACETSLKNLNLSYLDNYLIHWPMAYKDGEELYPRDENNKAIFSNVDYVDTWRAMEDLVDAGLCLNIGFSNFNISQIERILKIARIPPANIQFECHPYLVQQKLQDFCKSHNIAVTSYSSLGSPSSPYAKPGEYPILQHPKVLTLAEKYKRTPAQLLLRYQLDRGNIVLPRSANKDHMSENLNILDFKLSQEDVKELDGLDFGGRFMIMADAEGHPDHPFKDEGIFK
ncbi:aldo-keto reductase 1B-like [Cochliomyia hominivorax]